MSETQGTVDIEWRAMMAAALRAIVAEGKEREEATKAAEAAFTRMHKAWSVRHDTFAEDVRVQLREYSNQFVRVSTKANQALEAATKRPPKATWVHRKELFGYDGWVYFRNGMLAGAFSDSPDGYTGHLCMGPSKPCSSKREAKLWVQRMCRPPKGAR